MALYREDLERMRCRGQHPEGHPDCDHDELYFHGRCHPGSPTWTRYGSGEVTIICSECSRPIATLAVASKGNGST